MENKRSSSLQNYLDNLDKQSYSDEDEDDWGFFVDMEGKHKVATTKSNRITTTKKKININHYYYHHYYHDNTHNDNHHMHGNCKHEENDEATTLMNYGNILVIVGIAIYLFLLN